MAKVTVATAVFQHISSLMLYYLTFRKLCHMLLKRTVVKRGPGKKTL